MRYSNKLGLYVSTSVFFQMSQLKRLLQEVELRTYFQKIICSQQHSTSAPRCDRRSAPIYPSFRTDKSVEVASRLKSSKNEIKRKESKSPPKSLTWCSFFWPNAQ